MKAYRQSLVTSYSVCPRRAMHGMAIDDDITVGYTGASADVGSAAHAVFAEILRTLRRQKETAMSTQEAIEVMYEVMAAGPWVLPADERDALRGMVLSFVTYREQWPVHRFLPHGTDLDDDPAARLRTEILCPDGELRELTGRPDLIVADPPDALVIADFKTGKGRPPAPMNHQPHEVVEGRKYLSDRGHAQGDAYSLLAMRTYPAAQRVTFRELHLRSGEIREAPLAREELEHVEREIGDLLMKLDNAEHEAEGSILWKPRPGTQCTRRCPVARSCQVPQEQRGLGALETEEDADAEAARWIAVRGLADQQRSALKAFHEEREYDPKVGDGRTVRWVTRESGSRSFDAHEPDA